MTIELTIKLENDLQLIREEEVRLEQVNSDYFQKGQEVLELCKDNSSAGR